MIDPMIDVAAERARTPGSAKVVHLNNAGASLPTTATLAVIQEHLLLEAERGGYEAAASVADRIGDVHRSAARLLGGSDDEIVLTGSDTQAWTKAVWSFVLGGNLKAGQRVVTDRITYDSHFFALSQASRLVGASLTVLPSTEEGEVDVATLSSELARGDVALCAITHVPTHRGMVNPIAACGATCAETGVPYFVDLCQSAGQLPVDVRTIGCHLATTTGRKWLRGPRGTGLLWVEREFAERLIPFGLGGASATWDDPAHPDRYGLRPGPARFAEFEASVALQLGLGAAIDHVLELGIDRISVRVRSLADRLRDSLATLEDLGVRGWDGGRERCGIVTFSVNGTAPAAVVEAASLSDININWSESSSALFDMRDPRPASVVRASPHYYNTEEEVDRLVEVVGRVARGRRGGRGGRGDRGDRGDRGETT